MGYPLGSLAKHYHFTQIPKHWTLCRTSLIIFLSISRSHMFKTRDNSWEFPKETLLFVSFPFNQESHKNWVISGGGWLIYFYEYYSGCDSKCIYSEMNKSLHEFTKTKQTITMLSKWVGAIWVSKGKKSSLTFYCYLLVWIFLFKFYFF